MRSRVKAEYELGWLVSSGQCRRTTAVRAASAGVAPWAGRRWLVGSGPRRGGGASSRPAAARAGWGPWPAWPGRWTRPSADCRAGCRASWPPGALPWFAARWLRARARQRRPGCGWWSRLAWGMSAATKSTPVSISPEMKWTLRASRSSLAMASVAFCRRLSSMAFSSSGRLVWRLPDSISVNSASRETALPAEPRKRPTASRCASKPSRFHPGARSRRGSRRRIGRLDSDLGRPSQANVLACNVRFSEYNHKLEELCRISYKHTAELSFTGNARL